MKTAEPDYIELLNRLKRQNRIGSIGGILAWDQQVNLPENSAPLRAEQLEVFTEILHREATDPGILKLLEPLEARISSMTPEEQIVIKEARREYDRLTKIPAVFAAKRAKAQSEGYQAWIKARDEDNFSAFSPHLEKQIDLAKEEAAFLSDGDPYDYWIDQFDPGMSQAIINPLFADLKPKLKSIVEEITNSSVKADVSIFKGFPVEKQKEFLLDVVTKLGFDFKRGRIDVAIHPFCGGHSMDTRMTTRYHADNPLDSLSSAMHETGHALYEQGLPDTFAGTALSSAIGMAVHESQSRLWENQVGRSRQFWDHYEPIYRAAFPSQLASVSSHDLYLAINNVAITPIRVDADEVTYNLHILLRYELEKRLFNGSLKPSELPEAWNDESENVLGLKPTSNKMGCLQDVHWSEGYFGYFPSYCLGNLLAAQLWYKIKEEIPDLDRQIGKADFEPLLTWLRKNVHSLGRRFDTREFARRVTGKELSTDGIVQYLKERYLPLYSRG